MQSQKRIKLYTLGLVLAAGGVWGHCIGHSLPDKESTPQKKGAQDKALFKVIDQETARSNKMASADTKERTSIPDRFKWKTEHLYASDADWEQARKKLVQSFKKIDSCKGKLKQGKSKVLTCLNLIFDSQKQLMRLSNYAQRKHDQDTRVATYQGFKQIMDKVSTEFMESTSFLQPELLALPNQQLREMLKDKAFKNYDQVLKEILRRKPHILSQAEEALLASVSLMRETGYHTYSTFSGADLSFPTIVDEDGRTIQLTQALFTRYRSSTSRKVRKATFETFFSTYEKYKNTIASLLSSQINANIVYAKARRYSSALEASLDANNISVEVYTNMVKAVNKFLPLLHRYLELRKNLLGLKHLYYYDMYPPIVGKVELNYDYDEGRKLILKGLEPMGKEYLDVLASGLKPESGWVDPFPNKGKRSGAYMDGSAYDVHPFVLCNYLNDLRSVMTLAHEMGHALHSYNSNKSQPYPKADYSIFVAEVASTLNESLLMEHLLRTVKDDRERLYLLGEKLEDFRQTLFRQAMFAEFELALYRRAEAKEPLTADKISQIYLGIVRRYYGHDKGVVNVEEKYGIEWAYVPHFYYNFYVYQYVTGFTAATTLAEKILKDGERARERYITHLLKAGSSDYPINLLKQAGVDLTSSEPYEIAMSTFKETLAQAESLVKGMKKRTTSKK